MTMRSMDNIVNRRKIANMQSAEGFNYNYARITAGWARIWLVITAVLVIAVAGGSSPRQRYRDTRGEPEGHLHHLLPVAMSVLVRHLRVQSSKAESTLQFRCQLLLRYCWGTLLDKMHIYPYLTKHPPALITL